MNIKDFLIRDGEQPLDRIIDDGGFTSIFRTIGCIGDSLSSGEFESTSPDTTANDYHDYFEYSWGQYIARMTGCKVYNFSRGGMTAKEYVDSFAETNDYWSKDKLCQAYIIALGVNDIMNFSHPLGSTDDICREDYTKNADTFCGNYARIIQRLKLMQPHAKFFLMTMPSTPADGFDEKRESHAKLLYELADFFDYTYVLDLYKYAPVYDDEFRKNFFLAGHMNAMGYVLTAKMVASYIDYIIRSFPEDFAQVAFIGKGVHNYKYKW